MAHSCIVWSRWSVWVGPQRDVCSVHIVLILPGIDVTQVSKCVMPVTCVESKYLLFLEGTRMSAQCIQQRTECPQAGVQRTCCPLSACVYGSRSVVSDSLLSWMAAHQIPPFMGYLGKNTGVGCHALLQGIFLTQESNPGLLPCRQILCGLSHQTSPLV